MRVFSIVLPCIAAVLSVGAPPSRAQEGMGEEDGDYAHYRYAIAGFLGATRVDGENESTLGIEAGVAVNSQWSIGAVIERADRQRDSTLAIVGVGYHPFGPGIRAQFGVGAKDPSGETEFVFRAGLGWEHELHEGWFVKPYVAYDVINNEDNESVLGVYIGRLF